jgi:hypothetical protein
VLNSPNAAVEDGIGPDIGDGHGGCRRLSEAGEAVGNRYGVPFTFLLSVDEKVILTIYREVNVSDRRKVPTPVNFA